MFWYFSLFLFCFGVFGLNFFFFNEEVIISLCVILVFYFIVNYFAKLLSSFFFFIIDFIFSLFFILLKFTINLFNLALFLSGFCSCAVVMSVALFSLNLTFLVRALYDFLYFSCNFYLNKLFIYFYKSVQNSIGIGFILDIFGSSVFSYFFSFYGLDVEDLSILLCSSLFVE